MHLIRISSRNTRAVINGASDTSGHPASNKHSARYCPAVSRGIGTNGPNRQKTWPRPSIRPIPHPLTPPLRTMPLQPLVPSHRTITKRPPTMTLAFRYHSFRYPPAPASLSFPLSQAPSASAHTDAVAQPSPCPNHTQNTASSKTPKNICKGGPGPGPTFLLPLPLRVSAAARRRDQLSKERVHCSPVSFNDIKHLARSM